MRFYPQRNPMRKPLAPIKTHPARIIPSNPQANTEQSSSPCDQQRNWWKSPVGGNPRAARIAPRRAAPMPPPNPATHLSPERSNRASNPFRFIDSVPWFPQSLSKPLRVVEILALRGLRRAERRSPSSFPPSSVPNQIPLCAPPCLFLCALCVTLLPPLTIPKSNFPLYNPTKICFICIKRALSVV